VHKAFKSGIDFVMGKPGCKRHVTLAMKPKLPAGTLERLWSDPKHWRALGIYSCKEDPRLIVPKKVKALGWTMNVAHASAWLVLTAVVVGMAIPAVVFGSVRMIRSPAWWMFLAAYVVAVCLWSSRLSSAERFEEKAEPAVE
jgi:hypothetical protein